MFTGWRHFIELQLSFQRVSLLSTSATPVLTELFQEQEFHLNTEITAKAKDLTDI